MKILVAIISIVFISYAYSYSRPFASVVLNDSVYFDETEVDIGTWVSYYFWLQKNEGYESAKNALPDSSLIEPEIWQYFRTKLIELDDEKGRYSLQPLGYIAKKCNISDRLSKRVGTVYQTCNLLSFPITGLTYEQVVNFCKWRTKVLEVNKVIYRLPTPDEWEKFALKTMNKNEQKVEFKDSINKNGCPLYNYKIECNCDKNKIIGKLLGIGRFNQDEIGSTDVFGNVSEMTSVKGIAKGGNFTLYAKDCNFKLVQYYAKPEPWLGFRCIMIKIQSKK